MSTDICVNRHSNTNLRQYSSMSIGNRIKQKRLALGMNQEELAKKLGIAQGTLSNLETGVTKAQAGHTLAELCRVLKTTPRFIIEGIGDSAVPTRPDEDQAVIELLRSMTPDQKQMLLRLGQALLGNQSQPPDPEKSSLHISD